MAEVLLSSDLLETLPDAIVAVDCDGIIIQVNSQTQELFGYTRAELIGQTIEILVPKAIAPSITSIAQTSPKHRRLAAWEQIWIFTEDAATARNFPWKSVSAQSPPKKDWLS